MQIQTFEQGIQNTLSALTYSEKALAVGLLESKQYHELSKRAWVRAPTFRLSQAFAKAREDAPQHPGSVRFINIFCDTLYIDTVVSPEIVDKGPISYSIEIFARSILNAEGTEQDWKMTVNMVPDCEITFWNPNLPSSYQVEFVLDGKTTIQKNLEVSRDNFGIKFRYENDTVTTGEYPPPDGSMELIDYLSLIQPNGTVKPKGFLNDDLPRLLQMQLLVAQANAGLDRKFAVEVLNFVVGATATDHSLDFRLKACALRNNLVLDTDIMAVSSVNVYSSKQILKARITAALVFETAFRQFWLETGNAKNQTATALNLLAKSNDAIESYSFMLDIRQREYDNAITAHKKASTTFSDNQDEIAARTKVFEAGMTKFEKENKLEIVKAVIMGVIEIGVAIAVAVKSGGSTAPAIAANLAETVKGVGKVAMMVAKLKAIYEKLVKIYAKIKPVVEKLKKVVEEVNEVVDALRQFKETGQVAKTLKPDTKSTDVFNATAEWRIFQLEIEAMEDSMLDYNIEGKKAFFMALRKLAINGESFILTQANIVQKGDELATCMLQQKMTTRDTKRLSHMVYNLSGDQVVLELLQRSMFDRLLAIRGLVHLDFFTYCTAYKYHTLLRDDVISLSPVKPVGEFLQDAAILQGAVVSFGSKVLVQSRKFTLSTLCGFDTPETLATQLSTKGSVRLNLSPSDPLWTGFSRIRMSSARCYLDGVTSPTNLVRVQLKTDGQFFDLDIPRFSRPAPMSSASMKGMQSQQLHRSSSRNQYVRTFLGESRTLLFEYSSLDQSISCDGLFGQERDYTKHTPITTWEISVGSGMAMDLADESGTETMQHGLSASQKLDFSGFNGLALEFVCDVVWTG